MLAHLLLFAILTSSIGAAGTGTAHQLAHTGAATAIDECIQQLSLAAREDPPRIHFTPPSAVCFSGKMNTASTEHWMLGMTKVAKGEALQLVARSLGGEVIVLSEPWLATQGVTIDMNLGPRTAQELDAHLIGRGGDPDTICFWSGPTS